MKTSVFAILLLIGFSLSAQDTASSKKQKVKKGFGVSVVQVQPEFPGGTDSLQAFLDNNLVYPEEAKLNHIHGKVYVGFMVDKTGKIVNPKILSSASKILDDEALRVVNMMPDWTPGNAGGTPVSVQYILPIEFITPPAQPEDLQGQ